MYFCKFCHPLHRVFRLFKVIELFFQMKAETALGSLPCQKGLAIVKTYP